MVKVTVDEMRQIDRRTIEEYGISSMVLMENAGRQAAEVARKILGKDISKKNVVVICGKGKNGGDGFVVARYLLNWGVDVRVFLLGDISALAEETLANFNILKKFGQRIEEVKTLDEIKDALNSADLVIDAILGIGVKGEVKSPLKEVIEIMNSSRKPILAIDIPSGLDGDTGDVLGVCVKATATVTMGAAKKGFFLKAGPEYAGELTIADIGIPRVLLKAFLILLLFTFLGCARPHLGFNIDASSSGYRDVGISLETSLPTGKSPVIDEETKNHIDAWIKENDLNEFGDPKGTAYAGGTPLFDEKTGKSIDRYEYILKNHPSIFKP